MEEIERRMQAIPPDLHWFCPKQNATDAENHEELGLEHEGANVSEAEKRLRSDAGKERADFAVQSLQLLAFETEDRATFNSWYTGRLDEQLSRCSDCVMKYHQGKRDLLETLAGEHDENVVARFTKILETLDLDRVRLGLTSAAKMLREAAPQDRSARILESRPLHALFEVLSSDTVMDNEIFMASFFDEPFELVQSRRFFRTGDYVPAMGRFLFDERRTRFAWALKAWARMTRSPRPEEFAWAVQRPLLDAMRRASLAGVEPAFLEKFWLVMKVVVDRLDKDLITHSLRALDVDVVRLGLDHLQMNAPTFRIILQMFETLLSKSPGDFWDAMGAISPASIVEMIFHNPQYHTLLAATDERDKFQSSALKDLLSWVDPFLASLKIANQPQACRALAAQLMERLQAVHFPEYVRMSCFQTGLQVLLRTVRSFVDDKAAINGSIARVVVLEVMEVVSKHTANILAIARLSDDEEIGRELAPLARDVIRNVLALDCQCFRNDYDVLLAGQAPQHDDTPTQYSKTLWEAAANAVQRNELSIARHALIGMMGQVGLERFNVECEGVRQMEKRRFNAAYGHLAAAVSCIFGRLSDFDPEKLRPLFQKTETASPVIAGLLAADQPIYEAATDVVKILSSQSGRKEALAHLLDSCFATTMACFSWAIRRISNGETFASNPRMLKTSGDVLEILCDSQRGILRTRTLSTPDEVRWVAQFWKFQWAALTVIFRKTETWAVLNGKELMKEFCRDTMEFADRLFDEYSIFSTAISPGKSSTAGAVSDSPQKADTAEDLLQFPVITMTGVVKWLKLRDEFLAAKSVSLVCKILRRLGEWDKTIDAASLRFVEDIAVRGNVRSALKAHEKAELARALDEHHSHYASLAAMKPGQTKEQRQSTLTSWTTHPVGQPSSASARSRGGTRKEVIDLDKWASNARQPSASKPQDDDLDDGMTDADILAVSSSFERFQAHKESRKASSVPLRPAAKSKTIANATSEAAQRAFKEKREKEKMEKQSRDRAQIAALRKTFQGAKHSGEGVNGIGVAGRDHAPPRSEMMVSSGSEDDEDEDSELDRELFGIAKPSKKSRTVQEYQESKLRAKKLAERAGPVRKVKQIRNAKDMRARLAPDLSALHQTILDWNFFHDGDFPPNSDRNDYTMVSNTFRTPAEYQATFQPLHVLEAWNGFLKSKEESNLKPFDIKIASRMAVDSFIELSTSIPIKEGRDLGLGEADIVLLSKSKTPTQDAQQPHCLARVSKINRRKADMEITYKVNTANPLVTAMSPNATLRAVKITSITPLEREYGALRGLTYYDLCEEILKAKPSPLLKYSDAQIRPLIGNYDVNPAQARAIRSAVDNDAFTLIQGPPGSGKTKTITAIVGAMLTGATTDTGVAIARPGAPPGSTKPPPGATSKKLLVCAPSNAAVDELVMRFKSGVKTLDGQSRKVSLVRLGKSDAINANVMDVTLDELVSKRLNVSNGKSANFSEEIHKLVEESRALGEGLNESRGKLDEARSKSEPPSDIDRLQYEHDTKRRKKHDIGLKLDDLRDKGKVAARDAEINRRKVQQEILDGADIICATLSGSGHDMFQQLSIEFETVIIDEAAQSVELSALIPLKYGCSKCILVGDPKQLPPTVLSRAAAGFQYEQSLFVRMQSNHPDDVHLLDTQYRMHPDISQFPSNAFYDGRLLDGPDMARLRRKPWHASELLSPYRFFDVQGLHQRAPQGHSLINVAELNVALQLYERLTTDYAACDYKRQIGIITPYKAQLKELKVRFAQRYGEGIFDRVEFNTTDAFQGRESEIIIFSCVRAAPNQRIGFLDDIRRMNVGLTRAKSSLWVLGNSESLVNGEFWRRLIEDARQRERYTSGDLMALLRKPAAKTDGDVAMRDAPAASSAASPVENAEISKATVEAAGGRWGLDPNHFCHICGSSQHLARDCDNDAAREASVNRCGRCGGLDHSLPQCPYDRCMSCGEIGHVDARCGNPKALTRHDRERVRRQEASYRTKRDTYTERKAQRQLGEHDAKIPQIKSTRRTPPLGKGGVKMINPSRAGDQNNAKSKGAGEPKRKREPSPPAGLELVAADKGFSKAASRPQAPVAAPAKASGPDLTQGENDRPKAPPAVKVVNRGPMIMRKKEVELFIRPKPKRPRP